MEQHYYPFGGTWSFSINDVIVGEIVQGSPILNREGKESNFGVLYAYLLLESVTPSLKADIVNTMLAYLALVDLEYYYYECDLNFLRAEVCPEIITVH